MRGHGHHKWKGMAQRDVWDARIRLRSDQIVVFWLERWWHMVMDGCDLKAVTHRERQTRTHRNKYHRLRSAGYDGTTRAGPGQDGRRRARVEETRNK